METPVRVDATLCTGCGACVTACGPHVLELHEKRARYVGEQRALDCIACGHCLMSCPHGALSVDGLAAEDLEPLPERSLEPEQLHDFLRLRRSVRTFADKPVERAVLERILTMAATAPMGFPPHTTEVVVIDDRAELDALGQALRDDYDKLRKIYDSRVGRLFLRASVKAEMWQVLSSHVIPVARDAAALWQSEHADRFLYGAPVLMLFHGDRFGASPDEDCHLVCTYAMLAAHALGLGTTILGIVPPIVERSAALRERYGIPARNRVVTSLILGYPKGRYRQTIRRPLRSVRFVGKGDGQAT